MQNAMSRGNQLWCSQQHCERRGHNHCGHRPGALHRLPASPPSAATSRAPVAAESRHHQALGGLAGCERLAGSRRGRPRGLGSRKRCRLRRKPRNCRWLRSPLSRHKLSHSSLLLLLLRRRRSRHLGRCSPLRRIACRCCSCCPSCPCSPRIRSVGSRWQRHDAAGPPQGIIAGSPVLLDASCQPHQHSGGSCAHKRGVQLNVANVQAARPWVCAGACWPPLRRRPPIRSFPCIPAGCPWAASRGRLPCCGCRLALPAAAPAPLGCRGLLSLLLACLLLLLRPPRDCCCCRGCCAVRATWRCGGDYGACTQHAQQGGRRQVRQPQRVAAARPVHSCGGHVLLDGKSEAERGGAGQGTQQWVAPHTSYVGSLPCLAGAPSSALPTPHSSLGL